MSDVDYRTLNPATGELVERYELASDTEIEEALEHASQAFRRWSHSPIDVRAQLLNTAADRLEQQADALAELMALEMGKPLAEGVAEANKCAWVCRYYAEHGPKMLSPSPRDSDGSEAWVRFDPLGPVLAIMPWNFPLWQVLRFSAPALLAGNVVLLKHAPSVPRCALAIERLILECGVAGLEEGVFQNLFLTNTQASRLIRDDRVQGVTLTGSSRAGKEVGSIAGSQLKTMVMELGGSDPFIVFDDANIAEASSVGVLSRCTNSGQSCIAAKRFLVEKSVFDPFVEHFVTALKQRRVGDPMAEGVAIGPLARQDLRDHLSAQVEESISQGARVLHQGELDGVNEDGFFFAPTVLTGVQEGMPAHEEELFGPVAVVMPFEGEDQALQLANETDYGLGASVWTADPERAKRLVPRIDAGAVFVNGLVKSDPRLPFGGVKDSGFGRELGREGLVAFVNQKTVWIK